MKKAVLIAIIFACAFGSTDCSRRRRPKDGVKITSLSSSALAVSLRGLQSKLKSCQPKGSCEQTTLELAGLKKIIGFVADEANRDLILFGYAEPELPPLYLEDFVVALRNAWYKYAKPEGGVYLYSHPGCSIDPTPDAMRAMEALERRRGRFDPNDRETFAKEWRHVCQMPQQVRVLGIPFNTRFAQVMVKADYDLKTLADGTDALDLPGFIGMMEMKVKLAQQKTGRAGPSLNLNRFWLYPGETLFEEDAGVIAIKQCFVRLLTEQMHADAKGEVKGSGGTELLAKTFSDNFTALYRKIAQQRPIYHDLENLFRFVALAEAVKSRYDDAATRFELGYLLDSFPVREVKVDERVPGRAAVKFEDFKLGDTTFYQRFSSCGGVDIAIEPEANHFSTDTGGRLAKLKSDLQSARPGSGAPIVWGVPSQAGFLAQHNLNARIQETNRFNNLVDTFTIVDRHPGYELFDGTAGKLYSVAEVRDLTRRINELAAADAAKTVYVELQGFNTQGQLDAFAKNFKTQRRAADIEINIETRLLWRQNSEDRLAEHFTSSPARPEKPLTGEESIEIVTQGPFTGLVKAVVRFVVQGAHAVHQVTLTIYARTPELARAFLQHLAAVCSTDFQAKSLAEAVNEARLRMKATHPTMKPEDLILRVTDELSHDQEARLKSPDLNALAEAAE